MKSWKNQRVIPFRAKTRWMKSRVHGLLRERRRERACVREREIGREGGGGRGRENQTASERVSGTERKIECLSVWMAWGETVRR